MINYKLVTDYNIAGFTLDDAKENEKVQVLTKAFINSDQINFYDYIEQISNIYLSGKFINNIINFLIIIHSSGDTDVYINDFSIQVLISIKNKIDKGQIVTKNNIVDIQELKFNDINIQATDKIIFCFKNGWKFGLYFNLTGSLNINDVYKELGRYYKTLSFEKEYSILQNKTLFDILLNDGWFPFIQLIGNDFIILSEIYKHQPKGTDYFYKPLMKFIDSFNKEKIENIVNKWWDINIFQEKKKIIIAGIEAYLQNSDCGFINCIKTLYSELEGIIRIEYFKTFKKDPNFKQIKNFVKEKAKKKFIAVDSLTFPNEFYIYLDKIIFNNFDLENNQVNLSRHTSAHGVANANDYNKMKALQAIFTIDQIYYYFK